MKRSKSASRLIDDENLGHGASWRNLSPVEQHQHAEYLTSLLMIPPLPSERTGRLRADAHPAEERTERNGRRLRLTLHSQRISLRRSLNAIISATKNNSDSTNLIKSPEIWDVVLFELLGGIQDLKRCKSWNVQNYNIPWRLWPEFRTIYLVSSAIIRINHEHSRNNSIDLAGLQMGSFLILNSNINKKFRIPTSSSGVRKSWTKYRELIPLVAATVECLGGPFRPAPTLEEIKSAIINNMIKLQTYSDFFREGLARPEKFKGGSILSFAPYSIYPRFNDIQKTEIVFPALTPTEIEICKKYKNVDPRLSIGGESGINRPKIDCGETLSHWKKRKLHERQTTVRPDKST